ncbi:MAG: glucose 1-dehydrogenase [Candidatus Marinimicrobia bacterium]|nr:glucose 1-dehydrogenase [Candidatus Neomarinimicrobiota bacterium]
MNRVQDKVVIVTGGAVGIGRAACTLLAREGASVVIADIQDDAGRELAERLVAEGLVATFKHLDVANEDEVRAVVDATYRQSTRLDVLVNNAGIAGANKPTHELTVEEWQQVMDVNVKGVFLGTKYAVPCMLKGGGGSIINLSSIYGLVGAPDIPPYHASKGAVRLMTKTDALLYAAQGIRVNSVHPGYIWTPLVEQLAKEAGQEPAAFRRQLDAKHPLGHVGKPDDIAYGILYLASDESKFITGSELVIDGGYTAR